MDLSHQLAAMGAPSLAALLDVRPEVLWPPAPRDLAELAERLDDPAAIAGVLRAAPLPPLQVAEALAALGGRTTRRRLLELLGAGDDHPDVGRAVQDALGWLERRMLLQRESGESGESGDPEHHEVLVAPRVAGAFGSPLNAGRPLGVLLTPLTGEVLKRFLRELGVPAPKPKTWTKGGALAAVTDVLSDPGRVREIAAGAPAGVQEWLTEQAWGTESDAALRYDQASWQREQTAVRWAAARGLLITPTWAYGHEMPAEVSLALRGPGYRAPFTGTPPEVSTTQVPAPAVREESAVAATAFDAASTAVLDRVRTHGVPTLKSGGVGARELTRLAQLSATSTVQVRLVLELADALGLLEEDETHVRPSGTLAGWRDAEPAERHAAAVSAWRDFGGMATREREDGKARPALRADAGCAGCAAGRLALLARLGELAPGEATDVSAIAGATLWARPLVHAGIEGEVPFELSWREGEMLGVVARGALAPLGRALVVADTGALVEESAHLLPSTVDEAIFGADSTAVVTGTPSARVTALLDSCGDRESRGAGVVWRLSPGSVRRALDAGTTGEALLRDLEAIARSGVPSTMKVLVKDVARRHGSLRVREVVCVVRGEDVALLAQAAADRSLRKLGLSLLAPTVLASAAPAEATLTALRAAGYLPVPEDAAGEAVLPAPAARPAASRGEPEPPDEMDAELAEMLGEMLGAGPDGLDLSSVAAAIREPLDVPALAARLVEVGLHAPAMSGTSTEDRLASLAPRLPATQVRLLAHAVDTGGDVTIRYVSSTGGRSERQITALGMIGGSVRAWCHVKEGERHFNVSRIQAVGPAG